jgi:hypothetical protein
LASFTRTSHKHQPQLEQIVHVNLASRAVIHPFSTFCSTRTILSLYPQKEWEEEQCHHHRRGSIKSGRRITCN